MSEKSKITRILLSSQQVSISAAFGHAKAVEKCCTIKNTIVHYTGELNCILVKDWLLVPDGKIHAGCKVEGMHIRFTRIQDNQTNVGSRGCSPTGVTVPTTDCIHNLTWLYSLLEEFNSSSFLGVASKVQNRGLLFPDFHHHIIPVRKV
mmetsp:Transcript_13298/g.21097  ORF Transcript_13298/g.21097 Transcript_13298/m.21097 type:complete len:149 (-) Transcript_13298:405-851(-)